MEKPKSIGKFPSKPSINLKDVPPLDPSSITSTASVKYRTKMVPIYVPKRWVEKNEKKLQKTDEFEEDHDGPFLSTIQIDPNSTSSINRTPENKPVPESEEALVSHSKSKIEGTPRRGSAKSQLHEICAARHWKAPVYECCNDEGPCHMKSFTYKVVIEITDSSHTLVLESFGTPESKKKTAAESAAEGALWYLKQSDHLTANRRSRKAKTKKASSGSSETL